VRDGVALLAILGRVRRRLRILAAVEGAVVAGAMALGALAVGFVLVRGRAGGVPAAMSLPRLVTVALLLVATGATLTALRRIPLQRCARILDRTLGGHDRMLSALAFVDSFVASHVDSVVDRQMDRHPSPFVAAVIADAVRRGGPVAPSLVAPFRRPRGAPALALAVVLVGVAALVPLPARGSRAAAHAPAATAFAPAPRVRLGGHALDAEREEAAAAGREAGALGDPELAQLARTLAATVQDLSTGGLARDQALDRLAELQRRSEAAADELTGLQRGLEQAGKALQGAAATRDSGHALEALDIPATETALNDLAAKAGQPGAAADAERVRIAEALDKASDRAAAAASTATAHTTDTRPTGTTSPTVASSPPGSQTEDTVMAGADPSAPEDDAPSERHRRLARDQDQNAAPPAQNMSPAAPRAAHERRLQRLERDLRDAAAGCRANPEACRRKLQHQAQTLPRMEDEARSFGSRRRLADAVRQLRERLRREANGDGAAGAGKRAREEKRFMRSARGEGARKSENTWPNDSDGDNRVATDSADSVSDERDDSDGDGSGDGEESPGGAPSAQAGGGEEGASAAPASGANGQENATGQGIGNQRGGDPLGEQGAMTTRGRAREAQVRNGAGPSRSQVIQSAARRGFAHTTYQGVYADYQAAVEESLDASAVPPGQRYIVRRYFQLIRPQSPRAPR
jgi:hypothetical protein